MTAYAVLFPGQGSQSVGMDAGLFEARPDLLGAEADDILGWSLETLCREGPEEELTRTDRAQPALYALSYALWEVLAARLDRPPAAAAGHSLGEYTALAAAGVFDFRTGLRLVRERGEAMEEAARTEPSGMAALLGADPELAEEVAAARREAGGRLWVANLNAPGQVVVSGAAEDIGWVAGHARELGVRRAVPLKVQGGFHSPLMASASRRLRRALEGVAFREPSFPVWSNAAARPVRGGEIGELLAEQLVSPVRFADTLEGMAGWGIETFVHVGPGEVTAGMARRTVPEARVLVVSGPEQVGEAAAALSAS